MMVWFETIPVVLTALSGLVWLLDKLFLAKQTHAAAARPLEGARARAGGLFQGVFPDPGAGARPAQLVAEPFRIPSSSMMPTLLIGDFILVNKFAYGLRWPITNKKFIDIGEPDAATWSCSAAAPSRARTGSSGSSASGRYRRVPRQPGQHQRQAVAVPGGAHLPGRGPGCRCDRRHGIDRRLPGRPHFVLSTRCPASRKGRVTGSSRRGITS